MDALSRRQWLGTAGWQAALTAAGGSAIAGPPSGSAQARSAEGLIGAPKAARVFDRSFAQVWYILEGQFEIGERHVRSRS